MKVVVTGASGLIGSALVPRLERAGHLVTCLTRGPARHGVSAFWNPSTGEVSPGALDGVDSVVHLAGESIASGRWTEVKKEKIRDSRVLGTRRLAETLASLPTPPRTLVTSSAIGFYGDRGEERLDEAAIPGVGFLPDVCEAWEAATEPAQNQGVRVVHLRTGIVLTAAGGALAKMLTPFKLGLGGVIGSGRQYMSWITIDDLLGALLFGLTTDVLRGPVNAVAPVPVTNLEFTKTLGHVLRRPSVFPLPAFAARLAFGEMADGLLLASARVYPSALDLAGFRFSYPTLEGALRHVLGRSSGPTVVTP